ncbi:sensor domain-containing diguanylate cyclase [Rheinheimera fenheensis]|uniref:sensor domain-containing diguanylate cyclase n=1 Tax=Rheinheimera fenheensis TaxID=3152295 RepID=UPI00325ED681
MNEAVLKQILHQAHDAIIITDETSLVIFWNKAAEQLFEYRADEISGKDFHDLICPADIRERAKSAIQRHITNARSGQPGLSGVIRALRKNTQGDFYVDLSISSIFDENGKLWIYAIIRDVTAKVLNEAALSAKAYTDELTGLPNRRRFQSVFESTTNTAVTLCIFDIDRFKSVNDKYGHDVGDELIKYFASAFLNKLQSAVIVSRMGGEEFCALYATDECSKVIADINQASQYYKNNFSNTLGIPLYTFSTGISCCSNLVSHRSLMKNADIALYLAKENGRNRIEIH